MVAQSTAVDFVQGHATIKRLTRGAMKIKKRSQSAKKIWILRLVPQFGEIPEFMVDNQSPACTVMFFPFNKVKR